MYAGGGTAARGRGADVRAVNAEAGESPSARESGGEDAEARRDDEPAESAKRREELAKRVREANHFSVNWRR